MSCFASARISNWISGFDIPRARTSLRMQSVKSTDFEQSGQVTLYLHTPAWPRIRAPKAHIDSSLSLRISCKATWATIGFSSLTANVPMAASMSASGLLVRLLPAARVRSFHSCSTQHSRSWKTWSVPDIFVAVLYLVQRVRKYCHSSLVPAEDIRGLLTLSTLGVGWGGFAWLLAWMSGNLQCRWGGHQFCRCNLG